MTRGHRGSLLLRCRAFSSLSSCRFIPAHPTSTRSPPDAPRRRTGARTAAAGAQPREPTQPDRPSRPRHPSPYKPDQRSHWPAALRERRPRRVGRRRRTCPHGAARHRRPPGCSRSRPPIIRPCPLCRCTTTGENRNIPRNRSRSVSTSEEPDAACARRPPYSLGTRDSSHGLFSQVTEIHANAAIVRSANDNHTGLLSALVLRLVSSALTRA